VCRCLCCNLTYILSGMSLGVVLLDLMAVLLLVFWGALILFSIVVTNLHSFFFLHPCQHLLFVFLIVAILTGMRCNLQVVLICISFMDRNVEHFKPFVLLPMKKLCSVLLPISSLGHWFLGSLVFWAPCVFWLLIPCQMYSWQRFSPILWATFSIWWPFLLLYRSF
jgi:hypothetical protein